MVNCQNDQLRYKWSRRGNVFFFLFFSVFVKQQKKKQCRQPDGDETETGHIILHVSLSTRVRLTVIHNTQRESH